MLNNGCSTSKVSCLTSYFSQAEICIAFLGLNSAVTQMFLHCSFLQKKSKVHVHYIMQHNHQINSEAKGLCSEIIL